jgi:hypothetical protein
VTYRIARRGWLPDPLDHRDCDLQASAVRARMNRLVPILSRKVATTKPVESVVGTVRADLRPWCSPIEDQGDIGSCTAQAVVGALEYFERKTRGKHVDASRRFLYRVTRRYLGWDGKGDTGAFLRSAIKALRVFGTVPEQYWPYDEKRYDDEPEAFHYAFAQSFKALEYFRVPEIVNDLQQVLSAGFPFVFGFTCFKSIDDDEVTRTGVIPYPRRREGSEGGHAVLAVGYTDSHIIIRNSWGREWGDKGYGYLPWSYFDASRPLADDCWVLINASWMPDDEGEVPPPDFPPARGAKGVAKQGPPAPPQVTQPMYDDETLDRISPQIRVARGSDPLRGLPLKVVGDRAVRAALREDPAAEVPLFESPQPVSLYLRQLKLLKSFDWALFGEAINELYVVGVAWDLSGAPPVVLPPAQVSAGDLKTYNLEKNEIVKFVGDGLNLWPSRKIKGGLYVRLVVMESDSDVRTVGSQIAALHATVKNSTLTKALAGLAVASGVSAPMLAAVGAAADVLTGQLASTLQQNEDDLVALFDGTYGAENVIASRSDRYTQSGAEIELDFLVSAPRTRAAPPAKKKKARARR